MMRLSAFGRIGAAASLRSKRAPVRVCRPMQPFSRTCIAHQESAKLAKAIRQIQDKFVEAKDEYEMALESQDTTYAVEDNATAREEASALKTLYDGFMDGTELSDAEKQTIKEKLSARIRELTNGVENNLHDH